MSPPSELPLVDLVPFVVVEASPVSFVMESNGKATLKNVD